MGSIKSMEIVAEKIQLMFNEMHHICNNWDDMPDDFIDQISTMDSEYPFDMCLEEKTYEVGVWLNDFKDQIVKYRRKNSPTLTVGELKEIIKDLDDYEQVVIGGEECYWNINEYHVPNEDGEYVALTFDTGSEVDPRQF